MATSNAQGIQTLLEAEKEAAKTVAKARQYRVQKLKDAKVEAQKEIEALKAQKEKEFQQYLSQMTGSDSKDKISTETDEKLKGVKDSVTKSKEDVIKKIIDTVLRVEPKVHQNAKIR